MRGGEKRRRKEEEGEERREIHAFFPRSLRPGLVGHLQGMARAQIYIENDSNTTYKELIKEKLTKILFSRLCEN